MSVNKQERLSALVDDEVTAFERHRLVAEITRDPAERARWMRYHLIGDAIRNELPQALDPALTARIRARLETEAQQRRASGWLRPVVGAAAAVIVAVLVVVTVESLSEQTTDVPVSIAGRADAENTQVLPVKQVEGPVEPVHSPAAMDDTMNSYLVNHLEYASPRSMLPHARLIGLDSADQ